MPPKRTIIIDPNCVIVSLHRVAVDRELAAADDYQQWLAAKESPAGRRDGEAMRQHWAKCFPNEEYHPYVRDLAAELQEAREQWQPYDLAFFSSRDDLSESEKQRWRQAVRKLERDGIVELAGKRATSIRLTENGRSRVKELLPDDAEVPSS